MPIEPIKIPQNVHIEDRIVGPLTLKQVLICAVGGGFSYALFASISKSYGAVALPIQILVWLPAVISAAFAFVRINDLSMLRLCLLLMEKMNKPATRTWAPRRGIIINVRTFHTVSQDKNRHSTTVVDERAQEKLNALSTVLDRPMDPIEPTPEEAPAKEEFADLLGDEPMDEKEMALESDNPNIRRPVTASRITASPSEGTPMDGVVPKSGSVSIFHGTSPAPSH